MKRYWLFSFYWHEENGGFGDFKGSFETIDLAKDFLKQNQNCHEWHIVDIQTERIIESSSCVRE